MLNSEAQSEHLTSQLSWEAASLLFTHVSRVYLVDEFSPCVLRPHILGLTAILLTAFFNW